MEIKEITEKILKQAKEKGWGTKPEEIIVAEKIALIHSEISEAFEAYRKKNLDGKDGFKEELGDALTRILHLASIFNIDIEQEVLKKLDFNESRKWSPESLNEKIIDS